MSAVRPRDLEPASLRAYIDDEAQSALRRGALYSTGLGLLGLGLILLWIRFGGARDLGVPLLFSAYGAIVSAIIYALARKRWMRGPVAWIVFLVFVSTPTMFLLLGHATYPAGAATFITGPMSYLYLHLIIMTGFVFDARLSIVAGLVAGIGYQACALLARPGLALISAPDPALLQDLTTAPVYTIKAVMIAFAGLVVGALSRIAKKLIVRVLREETEKQSISRLFGQFVSDEVKEKIIGEKAHVVGERKTVVVLFSDIRGFSTFSEETEPEVVVNQLNGYFDAMVQEISARGGVIDKFIGDAIMAVFGGVIALDDPAGAALDAARAMRRSLAMLNVEWRAAGVRELETGIGMHHGEVLQGTIGSDRRKEFTVIGDAVNTASRVEGTTKDLGWPIVVTEAFFVALPEARRAELTPLGRAKLKGKTKEVALYGLNDAAPAISG